MSARHPIISFTGSSGAGTTTVTTTFQQIFRREGVRAVIVHGHSTDARQERQKPPFLKMLIGLEGAHAF